MNEGQTDALDKLFKELFPLGAIVFAMMPDGSLHCYCECPSEHDDLFEHVADLVINDSEDMAEGEEWKK